MSVRSDDTFTMKGIGSVIVMISGTGVTHRQHRRLYGCLAVSHVAS